MTQRTHYLKLLTEAEREDVIRMAFAFAEASPYAQFGVDRNEVNDLVSKFMGNPPDQTCILLMVDEKSVGVFAAMSGKNLFNKFKFTCDLMWWIDPGFRTFKHSKLMFDAYEYWAKEIVKAQIIQMVCPDDKLHNMYVRRGYVKTDCSYVKELH